MKIPRVPVLVLRNGKTHRETAMVIPETTVTVKLNNKEITCLVCRPENPEEPSIGYLCHFDVFPSPEAIKSIRVYPGDHTVSIQAHVERQTMKRVEEEIASDTLFPLRPKGSRRAAAAKKEVKPLQGVEVLKSFADMATRFHDVLELQGIFGAYRVAALADRNGTILCQAGDVGMDTTVDRVLGKAFLSGLSSRCHTLLISGHLRAELVSKIAHHGIQTVFTASMVTHLALETARAAGVDIIHTKESGTLTIYSGDSHEESAAEL
ncbi:MAG: formate dehydrogenase accessory sulfurtransferase FdhD [Planctomycetes bacterium]|nr:formate dehydrogenase accessory sulfurtransferase FdhD [Planctomycetota bacterium]